MVGLFRQSIIKVQQKRRAGGMGEAVEVIYLDYYELLKQIIVNDLLIIILYELLLEKNQKNKKELVCLLLFILVIVHMCNNKIKAKTNRNKNKNDNNSTRNNFDFGCCKCRNCRRPHCHYF